MKHLKMSMMLLLTVAIFTSCEKETINELNLQNLEEDTLSENLEVGYGIGNLTELYRKQLSNYSNKSVIELDGYTFYSDEELFNESDCDKFGMEGFENIIPFDEFGARFDGPLNTNTNNQYFTPGSIVSGLEFSSTNSSGYTTKLAVFDTNSFFTHPSKALTSNSWDGTVIIDITSHHITSVGMELYTFNPTSQLDIYDYSGYLVNSSIVNMYNGKAFFGVLSNNPISKIVLTPIGPNQGSFVAIDNISYGACGDDYDNDGVLNENDPFPTSNTSESLSIMGNHFDIENVFAEEGITMMDQLDALIAEINAQYNGENWDELHRDFTREISKLTYQWRKDRLISRRERSDISSAAWSANVPMSYDGF